MPAEPQIANIAACIEYTVVRGEPVRASRARAELSALLAENARLRRAAEGIDTFAWSSMEADCEEARVEGMKRIGAVRAALAEPPG